MIPSALSNEKLACFESAGGGRLRHLHVGDGAHAGKAELGGRARKEKERGNQHVDCHDHGPLPHLRMHHLHVPLSPRYCFAFFQWLGAFCENRIKIDRYNFFASIFLAKEMDNHAKNHRNNPINQCVSYNFTVFETSIE